MILCEPGLSSNITEVAYVMQLCRFLSKLHNVFHSRSKIEITHLVLANAGMNLDLDPKLLPFT